MRRIAALAAVLAVTVAAGALLASPNDSGEPTVSVADTRVNGVFLAGANVPWHNWGGDFGNRDLGVERSAEELEPRFAEFAQTGMRVLRWWMFPGDPWQVRGSIDAQVYRDIDAALVLAREYDLYYEFTLFSGADDLPPEWLTPSGRARAVEALRPLFRRYANEPRIVAYDVISEPEWAIWNGKVKKEPVVDFVRDVAAAVHAESTQLVTVGSATLEGLPMWKSAGLDFYQAHWYPYMREGRWCALCTDMASVRKRYGLDRPIVIGEFYGGSSSAERHWTEWYQKGYAGAFAWSLFPESTDDRLQIDFDAARRWADEVHHELSPPLATPGADTAGSRPMSTASEVGRPRSRRRG